MPRAALKAMWVVTAGVMPSYEEKEHSRSFLYTSDDYEADIKLPQTETTKFRTMMDEAHDYARGITNPTYLNWVKVEFRWA